MDDTRQRSTVPGWIDEVAAHRTPAVSGAGDAAAREQCAAVLWLLVDRLETRPVPTTCVPSMLADWLDHLAVQAEQQAEAWSRAAALLRRQAVDYAVDPPAETVTISFTHDLRRQADAITNGKAPV